MWAGMCSAFGDGRMYDHAIVALVLDTRSKQDKLPPLAEGGHPPR